MGFTISSRVPLGGDGGVRGYFHIADIQMVSGQFHPTTGEKVKGFEVYNAMFQEKNGLQTACQILIGVTEFTINPDGSLGPATDAGRLYGVSFPNAIAAVTCPPKTHEGGVPLD